MTADKLYTRYQQLRRYVGWTSDDAAHIQAIGPCLAESFHDLIDDFYAEIQRHPDASAVITGGEQQIARLKGSLLRWLEQLVAGHYDAEYVQGRWNVGLRHAQIGLDQVYTNVALSRLRHGLLRRLFQAGELEPDAMAAAVQSLNRLLDLDLAIIEDSYKFHRMKLATQAARQRSEIKFRNLVEAAACMIVILRDDFTIAYFSPFAEQLTGYRADDVRGKDYLDLFVQFDAHGGVRNSLSGTLRGAPVHNYEMPIRCHDGTQRWLMWNARQIDDFDSESAILAVGHDITERRRDATRLLQAERLAAIGETITGLAHEGRNAMQRINSCTEMLEFELEGNPEAMRLIRRSQQAQDDLRKLFDEVRDFAAPIKLEPSECHLPSIWREAWELLLRERKGRDATLEESIPAGFPAVYADRFRLVQVFRNLMENSLAACCDPTRVQLRARLAQPGWAEIRVRDNGPGLDHQSLRNVFQPFYTTKTKGTGLGMAIAQRVLDAHGGTIMVGDNSGQGAEFVIMVPLRNE